MRLDLAESTNQRHVGVQLENGLLYPVTTFGNTDTPMAVSVGRKGPFCVGLKGPISVGFNRAKEKKPDGSCPPGYFFSSIKTASHKVLPLEQDSLLRVRPDDACAVESDPVPFASHQ